MSSMMEILKKINGLAIAPVSDGADLQNKILCQELPFKIYKYESGREHNGWLVPQKWEVIKAEIRQGGRLIYDGQKNPLGVISYSQSFKGRVGLAELKKHLYYKQDAPDNIVYHCDLYYKPHLKLWGFCLPYNLFKKIKKGQYEVNLQTRHSPGQMKVLEYEHKGRSPQTIVFNAHNCHAAQLNDGPVGYVIFMEIMKRLKERKTKYTYRLVIAPEHLGTVFYTANFKKQTIKNLKGGIFLEMVGHQNPIFALQESFTGQSIVDKIAHHVLKFKSQGYWSASYRQFIGNDECVWEAPGYEMPTISLSRCYSRQLFFPEYHLDSDDLDLIKKEKLEETLKIIMEMVEILEKNCALKRKFKGLIALSNPKYDLYISPGDDPSLPRTKTPEREKWNNLMNCVGRYFDGRMSILDIAIKHDLPFDQVYNYLVKFKEKDLVEFIDK